MHKIIEYIGEEIMTLDKKAGNGKLSMQELQYLDTLTDVKKNLLKCQEMEGGEEGYSGEYSGRRYSRRGGYSREDGGSMAGGSNRSYEGGSSYARQGRGPYARRDRYGRYSSEGGYSMDGDEIIDELRELMEQAPEDKKQDFQRFIAKMER